MNEPCEGNLDPRTVDPRTVAPETIDPETVAFYLEVPPENVVRLQAYFEIYEGPGIVRTFNVERSLVMVIAARDMSDDCKVILEQLREDLLWNPTPERPEGKI